MPKRKYGLTFVLKFVFSFSVIALILIFKTSIKDIINTLKELNLFLLVLSFSLHAIGLFISAVRWQILIHAQDDSVPLGFLAKSYLVGSFFNLFLPTRIGGDIVRIWDGSRYSKSLLKSSATILVERFSGILVLFTFAFTASILRIDMAKKIPVIWISLALGFLGLCIIAAFFTPIAGRLLGKIPNKGILKKVLQIISDFRQTILFYKKKKTALFKVLIWAFLLQVNVVIHYFLIGKALHLNIDLLDYFIFIPIVHFILLIPITINGLGLREGSYIEIFTFYGILPEAAFCFSIIDLGFMLIIGIIGGIIYVLRK